MITVLKILFGVIYTLVLAVCGIGFIGFDKFVHSTPVFLSPLITWFLVLWALYLTSHLTEARRRIFFASALTCHYIVTVALFIGWESGVPFPQSVLWHWNAHPLRIVFTVVWYVLGQITIWVPFIMPKAFDRIQSRLREDLSDVNN